jgi:hypothetical protein
LTTSACRPTTSSARKIAGSSTSWISPLGQGQRRCTGHRRLTDCPRRSARLRDRTRAVWPADRRLPGRQHLLAEIDTGNEAARSITYRPATKIGDGDRSGVNRLASMAKLFVSEGAVDVLQVFGGAGYVSDRSPNFRQPCPGLRCLHAYRCPLETRLPGTCRVKRPGPSPRRRDQPGRHVNHARFHVERIEIRTVAMLAIGAARFGLGHGGLPER